MKALHTGQTGFGRAASVRLLDGAGAGQPAGEEESNHAHVA